MSKPATRLPYIKSSIQVVPQNSELFPSCPDLSFPSGILWTQNGPIKPCAIRFNGKPLLKWMIWGYHPLRNTPHVFVT